MIIIKTCSNGYMIEFTDGNSPMIFTTAEELKKYLGEYYKN